MAMAQDSEDPSGVRDESTRGNAEVARARNRKANAALQMANAGANWIEIAEVLGYPTPRAAKVAVEVALEKELHEGDREWIRRMASARLDRLLRAIWGKAMDEDNPEQLPAVREARTIVSEYMKYWGASSPAEVIVHNPSEREIETWVATVVAKSVPQLEEADIFDAEVVEE